MQAKFINISTINLCSIDSCYNVKVTDGVCVFCLQKYAPLTAEDFISQAKNLGEPDDTSEMMMAYEDEIDYLVSDEPMFKGLPTIFTSQVFSYFNHDLPNAFPDLINYGIARYEQGNGKVINLPPGTDLFSARQKMIGEVYEKISPISKVLAIKEIQKLKTLPTSEFFRILND